MCTWWQWAYWFCSMLEFIDSDKACVQSCRLTYSSSFSSISLLPPYPGELLDLSRGRRRSEGCWITFCLRGFICVAHQSKILTSFSMLFSSYHLISGFFRFHKIGIWWWWSIQYVFKQYTYIQYMYIVYTHTHTLRFFVLTAIRFHRAFKPCNHTKWRTGSPTYLPAFSQTKAIKMIADIVDVLLALKAKCLSVRWN